MRNNETDHRRHCDDLNLYIWLLCEKYAAMNIDINNRFRRFLVAIVFIWSVHSEWSSLIGWMGTVCYEIM